VSANDDDFGFLFTLGVSRIVVCIQPLTPNLFFGWLHHRLCLHISDRNELQQGTTVTELRGADLDCLIVTGDNAQCGYYVACCAGFLDPGVPVLLGEAISSDTADKKTAVSWTHIDASPHEHGLPLNTAELLGTLATDIDAEEQGKTNYALVLTGAAWDILRCDGSGLASSLSNPRAASGNGDLCDEALQRLLSHVKVAARFSPGQKEDIVRVLAATGRTVAMCGDGSNDCAALRAAHVGLALNGAEASMVAPFSSKHRSIGAVLDLLLEGRSAITTSFAGYRFLILQGLTLATAGVRLPIELWLCVIAAFCSCWIV
jgi:magnesium-transporting ATPase (P-type)